MTQSKKDTPQIHDLSWRTILSNKTALRELLEDYVPAFKPIMTSRNFDEAMIIPGTFITKDMREVRSDVIWKIPGHGQPSCFIYVLIEHQSTPDQYMAIRILRYLAAFYGRFIDKKQKQLPMMLPVVLYCGDREWRVPLTLDPLLQKSLPLNEPIIQARYFLIDVNKLDAEILLKARNAMAGLFLLEKTRLSEKKAYLDQAFACLSNEKDRNFMELVLLTSYNILEARNKAKEAENIKDWFLRIEQENKVMPKTMREVLGKMFREEGREEERKEGLAESLSALKKACSKRGIHSDDYQADFQKLTTVASMGDLIVDLMAADDPKAFLKERFGH